MLLRFAGPRLAASDVSRDERRPADARAPARRGPHRRRRDELGRAQDRWPPSTPESPFFGLRIRARTSPSPRRSWPSPTRASPSRVIAQLDRRHAAGHPQARRPGAGRPVPRHRQRRMVLPAAVGPLRADARTARRLLDARPAREPRIWKAPPGSRELVLDGFGDAARCRHPARRRRRGAGLRPARPRSAPRPLSGRGPQPRAQRRDRRHRADARPSGPTASPSKASPPPTRNRSRAGCSRSRSCCSCADMLASLALSGRLRGAADRPGRGRAPAAALMLPGAADAQQDRSASRRRPRDFALDATSEVTLAHVLTGNAELDEIAQAGLRGLSDTLFFRTSVEPGAPDRRRSRNRTSWPSSRCSTGRSPPTSRRPQPCGLCQAQRLSALGRHDPLRHARRRHRGLRRLQPERPQAAGARRPARHSAARTGAAGPRADPHLLPAAGFPRAATPAATSGSRPRPPMPNWSRACRSATSTTT